MNLKPLCITLLILLFCFAIVKAPVYSSTFEVYVGNGGSLAFQNAVNSVVEIEVTSGLLNNSQNNIRLYSGGGHYVFTALNDSRLQITYNVQSVNVGGDSGNPSRPAVSGDSITVLAGNVVTIAWTITLEPWLPVMFILGMTGLVSLFGGSLYAVDRIKKKLYQEGLINGVIFVSIGFALFISWLWA